MEGRKQKITCIHDNSHQKDRTASERHDGVQTYIGITDNCLTEVQFSKDKLLEEILSPSNLNRAYKQVVGNNGSDGLIFCRSLRAAERVKDNITRFIEKRRNEVFGIFLLQP